jgi:geranylgeranyl pyrophosphate synthase
VTATTRQLGKDAGRDAALHKSTYPSAVGVGAAQSRAQKLIADACAELRSAGVSTDRLERLAAVSIRRAA